MDRCAHAGVVPVVVIEKADHAVPTAEALLAGGIDVMEITMRTSAGLDAIHNVGGVVKDMLVGAGTVCSIEQCISCVEAGAKFIVSPGFNKEIVTWCVENDVAVLPGCVTPTEIMAGMELGLKIFKFFPANIYGGLKAMKALTGPFGDIKFIPTGGINGENLAEYIKAPFIQAVGGSWLCTKSDILAGNFERIKELASQASEIVSTFRE